MRSTIKNASQPEPSQLYRECRPDDRLYKRVVRDVDVFEAVEVRHDLDVVLVRRVLEEPASRAKLFIVIYSFINDF